MDLIYESTDATIVALDGHHDQSGLPGVSVSRVIQPVFDTGAGRLVYSFPAIMSVIDNSKWNTRGWAYQEARLSRRCLFFSRYQVYLVCRHSTWSEAVPFTPDTNSISELLNSQTLDSTLFGMDLLGGFWGDRLEFTRRDLSCAMDGLDAFRGIIRRSSFITLWGVPVIPEKLEIDPNVGFSLGLLWMKRSEFVKTQRVQSRRRIESCRRPGFPTWSWTSLTADIFQNAFGSQSEYGKYLLGNSVCFPENEANVHFWCRVNSQLLSLQDAVKMTGSSMLPEHSRELLVEGDFIKFRHRPNGEFALFDAWDYFEPDCFDENILLTQSTENDLENEAEAEALILVQWVDAQKKSGTMRFVLMVVHWIDGNHPERVGLLTRYTEEYSCDLIHCLPRTRRKFILQ
ncbi:MAG: hypothetical protein M1820_009197 [Bogoriella megaspora]|nr:MAG: hypothetical protein M1820_009197 [Bogoriella megaspora]